MKKQKKTKKNHFIKGKINKGGIDAGTVYGVLLLTIILGGAYLMLGNITPDIASPEQNQQVIIKNLKDLSTHSNLQLKDFPGITLTPTPSPTPTPTPTPTTPPPGTGGGSTCLVAGTKILMGNGKLKNIENINPGDIVMGYDTKTQKLMPEKVLQTDAPIRDHHYVITLTDGTTIGLTREHPVYSQKGWASLNPKSTLNENPSLIVAQLHVGDKLLKASGKYVAITAIHYFPGAIQTYNLKNVTGYNDFVANGIVTHNKGGSGPPDAM